MERKKIVIIGGGFAGIYTLKQLQNCINNETAEITIISKENYFLFTPMVHEVAGGGLDRNNIVVPIREISKSANFIHGSVTEIDLDKKVLKICLEDIDKTAAQKNFDILIVATGATNNYYNIPGAMENTTPLKTLNDATKIKNDIIQSLEDLFVSNKASADLHNYVVVGGGATGVELVVEILELIETIVKKDSLKKTKEKITISLVCGPIMLGHLNKNLQRYTKNYLEKLGIKIYSANVTEVTPFEVKLSNGKTIESRNVYWAAGVKPNYPKFVPAIETDKQDRIAVDEFLRIKEQENVFALGDITSGWPMLAYTATRQAETAVTNIRALLNNQTLKAFEFTPNVSLLSLGQKNAVGNFYGVNLKGRPVWFLWRTVYLSKMISLKRKVKIMLNWTFNLFVDRDISKI